MTVLLGCSANGADKLPPFIAGNNENFSCFKNVRSCPHKMCSKQKSIFTDYLRALDVRVPKAESSYFLVTSVLHIDRSPKEYESCVFPQNCTSNLQPLDWGIMGPFRHYYCKQRARKTVLKIDHKLLYDALALMKVNVLDALHFSAES